MKLIDLTTKEVLDFYCTEHSHDNKGHAVETYVCKNSLGNVVKVKENFILLPEKHLMLLLNSNIASELFDDSATDLDYGYGDLE